MSNFRRLTVFLLTAGALSGASFAVAAAVQAIEVDRLETTLHLGSQIELLEDPGAKLTFTDIQSESVAEKFAPSADATPKIGFSSSAWWVRVSLSNSGAQTRDVLLRQDYPLIDFLDLWRQDSNGEWQQISTGDRRRFDTREIAHRDYVFPISLPAQTTSVVYLRFESSGPINIGLTVSSATYLLRTISHEQLGYGIYFGGFLVLLVYNLFIFVAVRDRAFFYYLVYLACYGVYFAIHNGLMFQYFWPEQPLWGNSSLVVFLALTLFWGPQFSRSILRSRLHSPRLDKLTIGLQWLSVVGLGGAFLLPYSMIILPLALLSAIVPPVLLAMAIFSMIGGHRPAFLFLLAWITLLIGVAVYMLKTFGILPHNSLTQNGFQIGSLIEMVLLSLALASRVSELQRHSFTDALTGLRNRRSFDERLAQEIVRSQRYSQPLSLLMIDVDHFKAFNDTHGHKNGDDALRAIAVQMRKMARRVDVVFRYGGEEFAVLLPSTGNSEAIASGERLRERIEQLELDTGDLTISVGAATVSGTSFSSGVELLDTADKALYKAKQNGRNRVESFTVASPDIGPAIAGGRAK